ncbi:MAG: hypothetical protein ACRBB3_02905 [Alphaproteobacteria bacterium]
MSISPKEDNILEHSFFLSKNDLIDTFANSVSMHAHLERENITSPTEGQRLERAEKAYDHITEVIGFNPTKGTVDDFIAAVKTDDAQNALKSVPPYSTTLTLNRHIIATLDHDLHDLSAA